MSGGAGQAMPTQFAQPIQSNQTAMGTPITTGNTYSGSGMQNNSGSKGTGQPTQTAMGTPIVTGNTYLPQSSMVKNKKAPLAEFFDNFNSQGY